MKHRLGKLLRRLGRALRAHFLAGILAVVPIGLTVWILVWLFTTIDNILQPAIQSVWGHSVPGVGFGITILLIYLIGVIASNVLGSKLIRYGESLLARVPIARLLYNGIKQVLQSFSMSSGQRGYMEVVLVEFPRKGIRTIGFVTKESFDKSGKALLNVFIPTSPNPTSGFLQIVREDDIIRTSMSVEDALKMVISTGRISPAEVGDRLTEMP